MCRAASCFGECDGENEFAAVRRGQRRRVMEIGSGENAVRGSGHVVGPPPIEHRRHAGRGDRSTGHDFVHRPHRFSDVQVDRCGRRDGQRLHRRLPVADQAVGRHESRIKTDGEATLATDERLGGEDLPDELAANRRRIGRRPSERGTL